MPARDNGSMAEHTQLIDAINICTSIRSYDPDPIDDDTARQLDMTIDAVNMLADAHIQLVPTSRPCSPTPTPPDT